MKPYSGPRQDDGPRSLPSGSLVGLGLVYGAGMGTAIGIAVAGSPGLAIGACLGAGLGVVAGAAAELWRQGTGRPGRF